MHHRRALQNLVIGTIMVILQGGCASQGESARVASADIRESWEEATATANVYCKEITASTLVEKEEVCQSYWRGMYQRFSLTPDTLREAEFAYRLAIAERVDRGQLGIREARFLVAQFRRDIEAEWRQRDLDRRRLAASERAASAADAAAFLGWYTNWMRTWQHMAPRDPITCTGSWFTVTCR
jgi:hypothetical protein